MTSRRILQLRAELLAQIRAFFAARGVLEVDTPALSKAAVTAPYLHSFAVKGDGYSGYLHTSPEFFMKRLLASGSGDIYQIAKVFRAGEQGARHNPEFSLLEWYRVGFDHHRLMTEVTDLILSLANLKQGSDPTIQRIAYQALFQQHLALDPITVDTIKLAECAHNLGIQGLTDLSKDAWLDLLMSHYIEPRLNPDALTFVYDYPASQAALARLRPDQLEFAERFELYWGGLELANGFHELTDPTEQRQRFMIDNQQRHTSGLPLMPIDEHFLAALTDLPACAGVALGIDRLLMVLADRNELADVLSFSIEYC